MKKHVQKGFTLIELIIVMALFSLVMYGVLQFLDPVTKFFVRSSNFETTTACIDNMKRAIEGNLKYADRVRAYALYDSSTIDTNVELFWKEYFQGRELMDCKGDISVMMFDNTSTGTEWFMDDVTEYNKTQKNRGRITMRTYHFDKNGFALASTEDWYVNQKMYANFNYTFEMGSGADGFTLGAGATFNPRDCTITIKSKEVVSDKSNPGRWIESDQENTSVASFSMKNVLDATNKYSTPLFDFKVIRNPDPTHDSYVVSDAGNKFKYVIESTNVGGTETPIPHSRYKELDINPSPANENFYFIFTQAETVYDAGERVYKDVDGGSNIAKAGSFVVPSSPSVDPDYDATYFTQVKNSYPE